MPDGMTGWWLEMDRKLALPAPDELQPAVKIYRDIFAVWSRFQENISYAELSWPADRIKSELDQGKHLLSKKPLPLDRPLFLEVLLNVVKVASKYYPQACHPINRLLLDSGGEFEPTLYDQVASLDHRRLRGYLVEQPWVSQAGLDPVFTGYLIFMAAVPVYVNFAAAAGKQVDFSIWRQGNCPVCGQLPVMAKLRGEDGIRILECRLCHRQWQFPRLECPFCGNRDFQRQQYFYADEFPGRRVQVCDCCRGYLKTAVIKEIGQEVVLEIDNLFTWQLDSLAREEGYLPGEELALINTNRQGG